MGVRRRAAEQEMGAEGHLRREFGLARNEDEDWLTTADRRWLCAIKDAEKLVMAEVSVIHMPCQEYLTFEVGHRLKKNSAVPFANSAKYIDVWTRVPHKVPVEFDSNFMIDENAISKVGRRVNVDKPHPPWCFAIQLYIVACSVLITHVAQPFVCGHQTIAHCIHLEPFACAIYGPSRENNTAMSNESARRASILFQPTLPVWGATPRHSRKPLSVRVSTHAPRVGSDVHVLDAVGELRAVSTHAPRVGSDEDSGVWLESVMVSTHAPRVGSDPSLTSPYPGVVVSTHAPRVGSDRHDRLTEVVHLGFNPRSPCGERRSAMPRTLACRGFNPRSPCGERHEVASNNGQVEAFQPTLPVWGAT